jgi:ribosome biogenesis GTPase
VLEGIVIHKSSQTLRVATAEGTFLCALRGKLRQAGSRRLPVVVGDKVLIQPTAGAEAVLEKLLPRRSELRRATAAAPPKSARERQGARGRSWKRAGGEDAEAVIAANIDQVLLVMAAHLPPPRWSLADRVLISAAREGLEAGICINKWDQVEGDPAQVHEVRSALEIYVRLGYVAFETSALDGSGIEPLGRWLAGRATVLSGHSGVGKSTLLNRLRPDTDVLTGEVNELTGKGRHVTTAVALYPLPGGGYLLDTPGFREYGLAGLTPPELGRYYPEFQPFIGRCRYKDCLHTEEPHCAVREALEAGRLSDLRYSSYRRILESL